MSDSKAFFPPESGEMASLTKPIAVLRFGSTELQERVGIRFRSGYDDIDVLEWANVVGLSGRPYALVHHQHAPKPGTAIVTRYDSSDPRADVLDVLKGLQLTEDDLVWTAPEASPAAPQAARRSATARPKQQRKWRINVHPTRAKTGRGRDSGFQRLGRSLRSKMRGTKVEVTPSDVQELVEQYLAATSGTRRPQAKVSRKAAKKR